MIYPRGPNLKLDDNDITKGISHAVRLAFELGCDVVKVFPADSVSGPNFIKSVLAPMPWSWIMPTGGVDMEEEGLKKWLSSGVFSVGEKLYVSGHLQRQNMP